MGHSCASAGLAVLIIHTRNTLTPTIGYNIGKPFIQIIKYMKKVLTTISISGALYLIPVAALAQFGGIDDFIGNIAKFINDVLVPVVFALAFLMFLWGVFKFFFWGGGDATKRAEGQQLMLWAVIGFLLMVSIWGVVNLLSKGFGLDTETIRQIPDAPINQ